MITFFCLERNSLLYMLRTTNNQAIILVSHYYLPFCLTWLNNFWSYFSHYSLSHLLCLNNWVVDLTAKPKMCIQIPNLKFNKKLMEQYQCLWFCSLIHDKPTKTVIVLNLTTLYVKSHRFSNYSLIPLIISYVEDELCSKLSIHFSPSWLIFLFILCSCIVLSHCLLPLEFV